MDILHLTRHIATYEAAILAQRGDIVEVDSAHLPAAALYLTLGESPVGILMVTIGSGIARHIDGLSFAPPHIAPQPSIKLDIRKHHIRHRSFVAVLDA